ncbi:protein of unknown function [Sphingobium sp. YR657]|uniref:type II toxin-antitoxin system toxin DNA ADP-ribosyl transferase DarT n=1 Tax=Sphingobium sp. YR657 TaxID=1884366 RepID=UPI000913B29C|nr:DUF4433 domain-containing protein [Sphingobium sp. YR657]SHM66822.1 protein of unknown function [Sphingobium sp. YR657]
MFAQLINRDKALIFRITHRANIPWIISNGLHCSNSPVQDPNFWPIGNAELIGRRRHRALPHPHEGTLSDYVPFYFTPFSPMLYNIHTGYGGVTRQANDDIVIMVCSIARLDALNVPFVFTDRHAYLQTAQFSSDSADLHWIDWGMLAARNFRRDPDDPARFERYEAEALVRNHLPVEALAGIACHSNAVTAAIAAQLTAAGSQVQARTRTDWYF